LPGHGQFARISWAEALARIAAGLGGAIATHGAEAIWPRDSRQGATVNATVDERDSDMGGGAVHHDNRVRVDKSS
jgi:anaerobic selenocysteine-containing dehydrogenase